MTLAQLHSRMVRAADDLAILSDADNHNAQAAARQIREWAKVLAALVSQEAEPPQESESLRVMHARTQGAANGFQQGWHAALKRVRDGDAADDLAALVPVNREAEDAPAPQRDEQNR